jgi:proteasome assembly chaperone (PAC2) family protein
MTDVVWSDRPELKDPVLVCAFKGWNDAGEAASAALGFIHGHFDSSAVGKIDPEEYYDFTAVRPTVRMTEGQTREIDWPLNEIHAAGVPGAESDLVMLQGTEPSLRWTRFTDQVLETAHALGVGMVITLGALLADVPHSRPVSVTGLASDPGLIERMDLERTSYEGPTGIVGVLHAACGDAGMPSASLWAAVPHYVAVAPNPKGALALLRRLEGLVGVTVDAQELEDAAGDYERQVTRAVELDPDVQAFVERLERAADEEAGPTDPGNLPSGDVLAREFQRFLRQRGGGTAGS